MGEEILGFNIDNPEQEQQLIEHFKKELEAGKKVQEIFTLPEEMLEKVYSLAYRHYQVGDYSQALELFRQLVLLDSESYRFLLGMAACLHKMEDYPAAASAYVLAAMRKQEDPVAYFHGAECFAKADDPGMAYIFYAQAIAYSGKKKEFKEIRERSKLARDALRKELDKG